MVKVTNLCTNCVQVITNPICPYCFSKQVITWLRDKNISSYKMSNIKRYLRKLIIQAEETPSNIRCIVCGSKRVNLCIHCFINEATRIIGNNTNKEVIDSFNEDFNTIIWRIH
jgi:hypothetical protein|tara:strand:- start:54 stop:392 length:339 start_codon:yes stop_codon:yes gene_type:complete